MLLDVITGKHLSVEGGTKRFEWDLQTVSYDEWIDHVDANLCADQIGILRACCFSLVKNPERYASDFDIKTAAKCLQVSGFGRNTSSGLPKLCKFKFGSQSHHTYGDLLMLVDETPNYEDCVVLCATKPTALVPIIVASTARSRGYEMGLHRRSVEVSELMDNLLYKRD